MKRLTLIIGLLPFAIAASAVSPAATVPCEDTLKQLREAEKTAALSDADKAVMMPFVQRMIDDPRMGRLYTRMATDFAAAGGSELTHFNDVGAVSIWGPWPATPDLHTETPRLAALKALSGR